MLNKREMKITNPSSSLPFGASPQSLRAGQQTGAGDPFGPIVRNVPSTKLPTDKRPEAGSSDKSSPPYAPPMKAPSVGNAALRAVAESGVHLPKTFENGAERNWQRMSEADVRARGAAANGVGWIDANGNADIWSDQISPELRAKIDARRAAISQPAIDHYNKRMAQLLEQQGTTEQRRETELLGKRIFKDV